VATDYAALREGLQRLIPFNTHVGLEFVEVAAGRGVVRLPAADHLLNHVGSQHAGALFAAGEAASGGAFIGAFGERIGSLRPLARSAQIDYRRIAKGPITATATLAEDAGELLERIDSAGRVEFPIEVELRDEDGRQVATMTVDWHVSRSDGG
jgi:acyl-coenzyme A thioesterase PaaI-like protein